MLDKDMKDRIDNVTYGQLLSWWRFTEIGNPMFTGETGEYFREVMARKKAELGPGAHVGASKRLGW